MKKVFFVLLASLSICSSLKASDPVPEQHFREIGLLDIDAYYFNLPRMLEEDNWKDLAIMGENALEACQLMGLKDEEFDITDQLVSSYFNLGQFEKSLKRALHLKELSKYIRDKAKVAKSYYKISAVLREYADATDDPQEKFDMYHVSRVFIHKSLEIAEEYCPDDENNFN